MNEDDPTYVWRGQVEDAELSDLHASAFGHPARTEPWGKRLASHSLGWVTARRGDALVGFVNLVTDGGRHVFLVDLIVSPPEQGRGIGRNLVGHGVDGCRGTRAEWLHVDFEAALEPFYLGPGGFRPTPAGLIHLPTAR